jgi:hypothetical protein
MHGEKKKEHVWMEVWSSSGKIERFRFPVNKVASPIPIPTAQLVQVWWRKRK